jgi:hypothetical protein
MRSYNLFFFFFLKTEQRLLPLCLCPQFPKQGSCLVYLPEHTYERLQQHDHHLQYRSER